MNHRGRDRRGASNSLRALALCTVLALAFAACGSSRRSGNTTGNTGASTPGGTTPIVDTSNCPAGQDSVGVSGNTITLGTSLPESGLYAPFTAILKGENSYFKYLNAQGGVEVPKGSGKKYQIKLVDKDDAYDAARTVTNVNSLINDTKVFSLFNVVGTKNNLGARDTVNSDCVPDLLIASGAVQWGNTKFPWMLGSELVPYPLEVRVFVDYLKKNKPNAKIAVLKANDDFGQSYAETLTELIKGTNLTVVQTQGYDPESSDVKSAVTSLAWDGIEWVAKAGAKKLAGDKAGDKIGSMLAKGAKKVFERTDFANKNLPAPANYLKGKAAELFGAPDNYH